MIEAPHYSPTGAKHKGGFALPDDYFDGTVNEPVLHQAVKAFLANQRQGTHATKTRGFVTGGNQKPWRQKGTGRARQGSIRAPNWPGGGTVFGPHPRDYRQDLPKKVKQLARRSALNARAREGSLWVIDVVEFDAPKTARFAELLEKMGLTGKKVVVLTHGAKPNVYLSARNVPRVEVKPYAEVSAYEIIWSDALVVEQGAITGEPVTGPPEGEAPTPKRPAKKAAARPKTPAKPRATKQAAAKKAAAKKAPAKKAPAKKAAAKKAAPKKKGSE